MAASGILVTWGSVLSASANDLILSCGGDQPIELISGGVEISVSPRGFGEIGLRTADGRRYLLAGVVIPASARQGQRREIVDQLRAMLERPVQLRLLDKTADRRGRRSVDLISDDGPIAVRLAATGLVVASGTSCSAAALAAEAQARRQKRGLWQDAAFLHNANRADMDLPDFAIMTGYVLSVGRSGRTTYLNFGTHFRRDVTVRLPDAMRLVLEAGGRDVEAFAGQQVEVRGFWMAHDGPELVLQHVEALQLPASTARGN
jgi:hypothetical protein